MYHLFGNARFYAGGGIHDYIGSHEDEDILKRLSIILEPWIDTCDRWFHIIDSNFEIVWNNSEAWGGPSLDSLDDTYNWIMNDKNNSDI